jgi:hypothetical protein
MKYNRHLYYAAVTAGVLCAIVLGIFLNVIQFEVYNRTGVCHPYFYQSSACRQLIASTIASDPRFSAMKQDYSKTVYDDPASLAQQVNRAAQQVNENDNTLLRMLGNLGNVLQNLTPSNLGKFKQMAASPSPSPGGAPVPSPLSQLQALLQTTVVDPTMTKYGAPLQRLVGVIAPSSPDP